MSKEKEIRAIGNIAHVRSEEDTESRHVEGYALVFGAVSLDFGWYKETIDKRALEGVLERSDILAVLNHDQRRGVLARYRNGSGSLHLEVDERGLKYSFDAPNTALGDELLESLKRGDITQSSFAFTVADEKWEKQDEDTYLRTILRFENLYDVSPVYHPAYPDTSVAKRSLEETQKEQKKEREERNNITFNTFTL